MILVERQISLNAREIWIGFYPGSLPCTPPIPNPTWRLVLLGPKSINESIVYLGERIRSLRTPSSGQKARGGEEKRRRHSSLLGDYVLVDRVNNSYGHLNCREITL